MSENSGVYMSVPDVEKYVGYFNTMGNVLKGVNSALNAAANLLQATAFTGLVGGAVVAHYIATIKPPIQTLSEKCIEISNDVDGAVRYFRDGDETGSARFRD